MMNILIGRNRTESGYNLGNIVVAEKGVIMEMSNLEMLKYASENGIIDFDTIQKQIEHMEKEKYLKMHPFSIWEGKTDKLWHTYLPTEEGGRTPKKRKKKEEIEKLIVEYWKDKEMNPTVEDVFSEWIEDKLRLKDISKSTYDRYKQLFEQCFYNSRNLEMKKIDEDVLESFVKEAICDCKMTSKIFSNYRTLLYGIFRRAKKKKYVDFSVKEVIQDIEISRNTFRKREIKNDSQVYSKEEKRKMEEYLENNLDIVNLGLLLVFKTGLRVGELAAVKKEDVDDYTVFIKRTETRFVDDEGKTRYEVKDFPKTEAGVRKAIIPTKYQWIIDRAFELNPTGEYLFEKDGNRVKTYSFRKRLNYICEAKLGIQVKSPHKARKTYGTILIDSNIKESSILENMGHTDINTTKGHYYYSMENIQERRNELDGVIGL